MASEPKNHLHFLLVPFLSPGHLIPIADIARLLAQQDIIVTIATTPLNANRIKPIIDRATTESGLKIRIVKLEIPVQEHGLPDGCESMELVPSLSLYRNFFAALNELQKPLEHLIEHLEPFPACIIADKHLAWTGQVASKFRIPRVFFDGTSCFVFVCYHNILKFYESSAHDDESNPFFVVPKLPHRIELPKSRLPGHLNPALKHFKDIHQNIGAAEEGAYGAVVNSFEELEFDYIKEYKKIKDGKVWCIGPVSLSYNAASDNVAERGDKANVDQELCLNWLNSWPPRSVLYICLGSIGRVSVPQLKELALGLEACNCAFILVMREDDTGETEKWLEEEGFKERTNERGLIIHGWAPQVLILSHPAVGAFLTHSGWNSILEAVCAGVPMISWPLFSDQFYNEKFAVQVLEIGVGVGCEALVTRDSIAGAIEKVMGEGKEQEERRERVRKLSVLAKKSMDAGGSSNINIKMLIEEMAKLRVANHCNL